MDYPSNQMKAWVVRGWGCPAGSGLTSGEGGALAPVINNRGEIAFSAAVKDTAGTLLGYGVFFLGLDGGRERVALPGQLHCRTCNGRHGLSPSLNDAGLVAFYGGPLRWMTMVR